MLETVASPVIAPVGQVDLAAYLDRIAYHGALEPTLETLEALHLHHATRIPFENLDIQMGLPIHLDLASLQAKMVMGGRGGYCFEQNTLFAAVLHHLGFKVTLLEARVRYRATEQTPRTHMALRVQLDEAWLADVGFGAEGLLGPVPLDGRILERYLDRYRVTREGHFHMLQSWGEGNWRDLYAFTLDQAFPVDFEVANSYTSTHPKSRFVQTLTVQLPTPDGRHILRNRTYLIQKGDAVEARVLNDTEIRALLRDRFGLNIPVNARFRALDD